MIIENVKKSLVTERIGMHRHTPVSAELKYRRRIEDLETNHCLQDMRLRSAIVLVFANVLTTILGALSSRRRR